MNKIRYIYKTTNLINGKIYIGQHTTIKKNNKYLGSGVIFKKAVKKYGKENFLKEIIEFCKSQKELNIREIYWIKKSNSLKPVGYNISIGGGVVILKGKDNPFYGKKHSKETIQKLKKLKIGNIPWNKGKRGVQKFSEETKKKISENNKGKNNWHYEKKGILSPNYGLKRNKETKIKLSKQKIGKKNPNRGIFEIYAPDGNFFYVDYGAAEFIRKHPQYNLGKYFIYDALKKGGKHKGWFIKKLN